MNPGALPTPSDMAYLTPALNPVGLQGVTALGRPGLPSDPAGTERYGDALQVDIPNVLTPSSGRGEGPTYTPHPYLPTTQHLDYVQKFSGASLLTVGLVLLVVMFVLNPKRAARTLGKAGLSRAGGT